METPRVEAERIGKLLLKGDVRALEHLLKSFAPTVLGQLARRFKGVLTREDLEDVISEALNAIWFARDRFNPTRGSILDWFYQTSLHLAVDLARRRQRAKDSLVKGGILDTIMSAMAADHALADPSAGGRASLFEDVRTIINSLPPAQRDIVLADIQHFPHPAPSQIFGSQLGINRRSIPVYRGRAHKTIREELKKLGYRFDESME